MRKYKFRQTDLAKVAGVNQSAVSFWLNGIMRPKFEPRKKLKEKFKIPFEIWDSKEKIDEFFLIKEKS